MGFRQGSLSTFCICQAGVCFSKLHFKHPGEDLGFLSSAKALPQLHSLPIILFIQSQQVHGHMNHDRVVLL
jgi:hypothetical protein